MINGGEWMNEDQRSATKAAADAMTPSDEAVVYMLRRIQIDPDLRWMMLHTEAFAKLIAAQAARTGAPIENVEAQWSIDRQPEYRKFKPRIPEFRRIIAELKHHCREKLNGDDVVNDLLEEAGRL